MKAFHPSRTLQQYSAGRFASDFRSNIRLLRVVRSKGADAMASFNKQWKVLPHGRIKTVDDRIMTVKGDIPMPLGKFPRRMTVVGLSRNRSAIFSAMALGEADMRRIEEVGKPTFLIVPNGHHRLDAHAWKKRYPKLKVVCPPGARESVSEAVPVDSTEDILGDKDVDFVIVEGTGKGEAALIVRRNGATTLIANDVIANVRRPRGLGGQIIVRLFGFGAKRPQVPRVVKRMMVKDKRKFAEQLREWSAIPTLRRIIPSHGDMIERPASALQKMAEELS
jgi:hypothetical protein